MSGSIERDPGLSPRAGRMPVTAEETAAASRIGWDRMADDYQAEHGDFLGDVELVWGPEGLTESAAGLLGPVADRTVLEVGCGAAQGSRWLAAQGAKPFAIDLSHRQLQHARRIDAVTGGRVPAAQADALRLPFADDSFDIACSAYGAVSFVGDLGALFTEVGRVLHHSGRWVFSVTHPIRWSLPDDPGPDGLTARWSYWDDTPYVERDEAGTAVYVEHHRTLGTTVRELRDAGFTLDDIVEPPWPDTLSRTWGGWSPLRGRLVPGTAIYVCRWG